MFQKLSRLLGLTDKNTISTDKTNITETNNKDRLENILALMTLLTNPEDDAPTYDPRAAFYLIKILSDKITLDYTMKRIELPYDFYEYKQVGFDDLFIKSNEELNYKYDLYSRISNDKQEFKTEKSFEIDLSTDPVLTFPWNKNRIQNALINIPEPNEQWIENSRHTAVIYLPVGVCFFYNGIHSSFSGMIKRKGKISVTPESNHKIRDLSKLYDYIKFDGDNYIFTEKNIIINKAPCFELGCIFEIGRLINNSKLRFRDL